MSHRDLGPVPSDVDRTQARARQGRPRDDMKAGEGREYHHFARTDSLRGSLTLAEIEKLAQLIGINDPISGGIDTFLNRPTSNAGKESKGIPAGYTYLYQLAAHDLVMTSLEPRSYDDDLQWPANLRRAPLELETLFGGGPVACPFAFGPNSSGDLALRLGYVREICPNRKRVPPARDLPRIHFDQAGDLDPKAYLETVLIPDPRNDDNLMLGQMTVLFHGVFNTVLDALAGKAPDLPRAGREQMARHIVARVYRRILREDLLVRILHPEILAAYRKSSPWLDTPPEEGSAPVEYAFAASRLAHAMVRTEYRMNVPVGGAIPTQDMIDASSVHNPANVPVLRRDLADWTLFFEPVTGDPPAEFNWAHRFGPHISAAMVQKKTAAAPEKGAVAIVKVDGTVYRDLLRERSMFLLQVEQLAALVRKSSALAALPCVGPLLDATARDTLVRDGLASLPTKYLSPKLVLTQNEINRIVADPPLSLYCQFEAWFQARRGAHLGALGSILTIEAMRPAFELRPWEMPRTEEERLETEVFGALPATMPVLLDCLAKTAPALFDLGNCNENGGNHARPVSDDQRPRDVRQDHR